MIITKHLPKTVKDQIGNKKVYLTIKKLREERIIEKTTELTMHKLLYFAYGLYYKKYGEELFSDPKFESWVYGPVEIDYRNNRNEKKFILNEDKFKKLNILLIEYEKLFLLSDSKLVGLSHLTDPWIENGNSELVSKEIPKLEIIHFFDKKYKEFEKKYAWYFK